MQAEVDVAAAPESGNDVVPNSQLCGEERDSNGKRLLKSSAGNGYRCEGRLGPAGSTAFEAVDMRTCIRYAIKEIEVKGASKEEREQETATIEREIATMTAFMACSPRPARRPCPRRRS